MTVTANPKAIYERFVQEVINGGRLDVVDELFAPDYVDHTRPPGAPEGLDGVRAIPALFRGAFPDVSFTIEDMVGEGDTVASRVTGSGTHLGPFLGVEPTGKAVRWASTGFFRVADGRIAEHWGVPDLLHLMQQLGAVPSVGGPAAHVELTQAEQEERARLEATEPDPADGKRIMRHHVEDLFNAHDLSELPRWLAPGYTYRVLGQSIEGYQGYMSTVLPLWEAFPDAHNTVLQMIAEGDRVATLWRATGTHSGAFFGVEPTGRQIALLGVTIERVRGGKRLQGWGVPDMLGLMQQLSVRADDQEPALAAR